MGALLENYYAIGHSSAANYVAQVSGQTPDIATQSDCPLWAPFAGRVIAGPYHQVLGEGCVYPAAVHTLGDQLSAAGRSWAAYLQDMGNDPARDNTAGTARGPACGHPATGAIDHTQKAATGDQYAARHDGFAFFRSVTGNQAYCDAHILSVRPLPGGLAQADAFLAQWVPKIMAAPAYRDGGLIVVTFDEGSDSAACCGEASGFGPDHPNVPLPGKNGPGGGRIGAVLLSPLIRPGTVSTVGLQPLLAAAHRGGHLRPAAPGRRGHATGQIVRPGRFRLAQAVNHFGIGAALGVSDENTAEQNMDQLRRMRSGRQPYRESSRLDWFVAGVGSKDESRRRRQVQVAFHT